MKTYENLKKLRIKKGLSTYALSKLTGISQSTISKMENGKRKIETDSLEILANALKEPITAFFEVQCPDCGKFYCPNISEDNREHEILHKAWEKAVKKFGYYINHTERDEIEKIARLSWEKEALSDHEKYTATINFFKVYFSRSLENSDFNLDHVPFNDYVAMLLNNDFARDDIPQNIYQMLLNEFGTIDGIEKGSAYYYLNKQIKDTINDTGSKEIDTIAAHLEGKHITPQKMKLLQSYIDALFDDEE